MSIYLYFLLGAAFWLSAAIIVVVLYNIAKHMPQILDWVWWKWFKIKRWHSKQSYDRVHPSLDNIPGEVDHRQPNFD